MSTIENTIAEMQRQQSDTMAVALMRMSVSDQATKERLQSLLDSTERHNAAKAAAEATEARAKAAKEAADIACAAAERRANEVAAEAEAWRTRHAQQTADLHNGIADLEHQRAALAFEQNEFAGHRKRHAAALASLRAYLADAE